MTIKDYKALSGKSYRQLGEELGLHYSGIKHAIDYPERFKLETLKRIGQSIGAPEDLIQKTWIEARQEQAAKRIAAQAGA